MMDSTASPSGQAPTQPASTTPGSAVSTPDNTFLGGDPAASTKPDGEGEKAAAVDPNASKPGEDGKAEGKADDKGAQSKAPEKYEFKFTDGVVIDTAALEAFTPVMREFNLTQEQGQKLADVYAAQVAAQNTAFEQQLKNEEFAVQQSALMLGAQRDKWAESLKNDKEIGGKNFDTNVQAMQKAIGRFGSPALKQLLNVTGLGNHPDLARFCLQVGQAISEDNPSLGNQGGSGGRKPTEDVFYASA